MEIPQGSDEVHGAPCPDQPGIIGRARRSLVFTARDVRDQRLRLVRGLTRYPPLWMASPLEWPGAGCRTEGMICDVLLRLP
jgi:hypothetical protein